MEIIEKSYNVPGYPASNVDSDLQETSRDLHYETEYVVIPMAKVEIMITFLMIKMIKIMPLCQR